MFRSALKLARAPASSSVMATSRRAIATSSFVPPSPFTSADQKPRHLLSIDDVTAEELHALVTNAIRHKSLIRSTRDTTTSATAGSLSAHALSASSGGLRGQTVPLIFSKRSTRTRVSTEGAVTYLGGHSMFLGKDDIQIGVNESLYDSSRVISSMTAAIVARVGPHEDILGLAEPSSVPVINALSDLFHPFQAITDIMTIREHFAPNNSGIDALKGLKVAWVGDATNVLHDLAIACAKSGIDIAAATPLEYPVNLDIVEMVRRAGDETGAIFEVTTDPLAAIKNADVVVTDTWVSMGQEAEYRLRMQQFQGYQVTSDMVKAAGANKDWVFMHCLPRHPEEVSDEVFYSDRSLVFPEAENRLYAAISVLESFVVNKGNIL
ncbi:uncharacterized protein SAPINGB_P003203 [Magnusiomyces paraingens]|uniref:ornithine carbamoyltransferase n=1 Tax=Magnusiomyces paraingens TaxID=2606893 RepID=A0A5E8BPZ9_9ASCO|nr:uncharacterized protein SAPINGB_P003203 [Saprochaete ingens]VVT51758.1 unnamed protein product [Saprochaete ingens]